MQFYITALKYFLNFMRLESNESQQGFFKVLLIPYLIFV